MWYRTRKMIAAAVAACSVMAIARDAPAAPLSYSGGSYSENFDTLPTTGNPAFSSPGPIDVPNLPGWSFAQLAGTSATINFLANDGSSTNLGLAGSFGTNGATDRSLGTAATTPCTPNFGFQIVNNTTTTFDQFALSYNGEMWRRGTATAGTGFLTVSYSTTAASILNGTFTDVPQLRFNSPNTTAANGAIDGNAAGNRTAITFTLATGFSWAPGQTLTIRWNDFNETTGSDDWLSVDDLSFTANKGKQLVWNTANQSGTWDTNVANKPWLDQATPSHFTTNDATTLADTTNDIDINVDPAGVTPIALNVTHAAHKYSLSGGPVGGALVKSNAGTLVLKSPNAFSSTAISGGTVETQADSAWGQVNINLSNGAIWKVTTNPQTAAANNTVNITGSATIYTETDLNMVHSITGANVIFTKDGPGLLWARHNFPLTGNSEVRVDGGTLRDSDDVVNFSDGIPDNVILRIAAGATFDESYGNGEQFSALAGDGTYLGHHVANGTGHINFLNNTNATFTFNGLITAGTNGVVGTSVDEREILALRKNGIHTAVLTNPNNDFAGQVQINNGVLSIPFIANRGEKSPIGMGNVASNPATPGADITIGTQGATPETTGTLRYTGASASSDRTINVNAGSGIIEVSNAATKLTLSGPISGAGNVPFQKTGPGTLILTSDNNNFSGGMDVVAGILLVNNPFGSGAGTGTLTVKNGGTLGGIGTIASNVSIQSGGTLSPGESIGSLNANGTSLDAGAKLHWEINSNDGSADLYNVNGSFDLLGQTTIDLVDLGSPATKTFTLIKYNGSVSNFANLTIGTTPSTSLSYTLMDNQAKQSIDLTVSGRADFPQWILDGNGSWGVASNWSEQPIPDGPTAVAPFLGVITAPRTVTLDGDRTVAQIDFDNSNRYTIAQGTGGTLTIGDPTIQNSSIFVSSGSHTISAPLAIGGDVTASITSIGALTISGAFSIGASRTLTKDGDGALIISGPQNHAAGAVLRVSRGTVNLNSNAGTAGLASGSNLTLNIAANAANAQSRVILRASQNLKELTVAYAAPGTQTLDLASGPNTAELYTVTVYSSNLDATKAALWNAIKNANAAGAADRFDGIIDSNLHPGSGVGIAKIGDHIYIRSTRIGDVNLDGVVTISDFIDLASNFNGTNKTWQEGDLNYDGAVTISDFIDLASNFNGSYSGETFPISPADAKVLADFAAAHGAAVPEPRMIGLFALASLGLIDRRRRR